MGRIPNTVAPTVHVTEIGAPFSGAVTVGTSATQVVPAMAGYVEDFLQVILTNASTGGQVLWFNDIGGAAVVGSGYPLQVNEKIYYSLDPNYSPPRRGIQAVSTAAGGSLAVTYQ